MKGLVNCNFLPGSARRLELVACRARVLLANSRLRGIARLLRRRRGAEHGAQPVRLLLQLEGRESFLQMRHARGDHGKCRTKFVSA
jgi:hypothetical protein